MDIGGMKLDVGSMIDMGQVLFWAKWAIIVIIIGAIFVLAYFFLQYKYKVTVFERGGSGNKDDTKSHFIRAIRWDRARVVKDKAGVISHWKLLLAGKKIEPVELKHVYPGNKVFLYKVEEGTYVPADFACTSDESQFNPIPQHIRRWQTLEIQQAAQDYQTKTAWELYAPYIMVLGTAAFCCVLVGVVIYFAFQEVHTAVPVLERVATNLGNVNVIPGAPQ